MKRLTVGDSPAVLYDGKGIGYCLVFHHPDDGRVLWVARIDKDGGFAEVTLNDAVERELCPWAFRSLDELMLTLNLAYQNGALIHGLGIGVENVGLMLTGHSGAGKSTLAKLFLDHSSAHILCDERLVVRAADSSYTVYGTPWHSDLCITSNRGYPLFAVFHLHHGRENRIVPCKRAVSLHQLIPQVLIPWYDREKVPLLLDFCGNLVLRIPSYDFHFTPDERAVYCLMDFMEGDHGSF